MKKQIFLMFLLVLPLCLAAETKEERAAHKNELRFTVGDCMWETLVWHNETRKTLYVAQDGQTMVNKIGYNYTPHFGLEYHYRVNHWLSAGLLADFQATTWTTETELMNSEMSREYSRTREHFYNLSLMPSVRFTYFWHPNVNLYSTIALGLDINGGTEKDIYGKNTAFGAALDVTVLGIAAGKGQWHGLVELGGLSALKNKGTIFMLCSKMIALGVSYTF